MAEKPERRPSELGDQIYIVCHNFYDHAGNRVAIGGVETYVAALCALFNRHQVRVRVLQHSRAPFARAFSGLTDIETWATRAALQARLKALTGASPGLVIYSDYWCVPRQLLHPCIVLQHGVGWDYWAGRRLPNGLRSLNYWRKRWTRYRLFQKLERIVREADAVLCVDTNFSNWVRAAFPWHRELYAAHLVYIPNFAALPSPEAVEAKWEVARPLRCIYPRRFALIRGLSVFASVVARLAPEFPHVEFAFVGEGEERAALQALVGNLPNVKIYSRPHSEMTAEYLAADVAVIPTLAAEGTSLSCIEAMSAGCAVLGTTVGGLGNLILPNHNGMLCEPTEESLTFALRELLARPDEIRRLALNARRACVDAFSATLWERRVEALVQEVVARQKR